MNTFSQTALPAEGEEILVMETNFGTMKFRLFKEQAPKTVENITTHAKNGYYNGLVFHRVIKDFMIQGGDPLGTGMGGESIWGEKFEDEFHADLKNIKGALSMANAGPNTNGSQFFIVSALSTPWLDNMHTVFGQLISGNEVLEQISQVQTGELDRPLEDVIIEQMLLENFAL
jgi:peptidyl-prolyl cis-trans isomerase B (cyclophilin B)